VARSAEPSVGARVRRTRKYEARQGEIVRAATRLINRKGVRGTTLADVAALLGIVPTGVTYYFRRKEDLAAACFLKSIAAYVELLGQAEAAAPAERRARFVMGYFELARQVAVSEHDELAFFNDIRALDDPAVNAAFTAMFVRVRALLGVLPPAKSRERLARNAIAHLILSQLFWSVAWLWLYDPEDYARAGRKMLDILEGGIAQPQSRWLPPPLPVSLVGESAGDDDVSRETFLRAATQLINEEGYRGASVEKISARLNVTKGSFYHHNEAKDDLVAECFRRTVEVMSRVLRAATDLGDDGWRRLEAFSSWLVEHQVTGDTPLLRTAALTTAPEPIREEILNKFNRISLSIGSLVSDGIADGSLRPVDAHIAAQMVTAMINAAAELPFWAPGQSVAEASQSYVRGLLKGLAADDGIRTGRP
jgi:AcrR family transcriptional regulator